MYRRFFNVNTGNAIKTFDAGGLKVTRAVPEKNIFSFFGLTQVKFNDKIKLIKFMHRNITATKI